MNDIKDKQQRLEILTKVSDIIASPTAIRIKLSDAYQFSHFNRKQMVLSSIRFWIIGIIARVLAKCGFMVLVLGVCRTGKTTLASYATPGRVLCFEHIGINNQKPHEISYRDTFSFNKYSNEKSVFTLDEAVGIDEHSLRNLVKELAIKGKGFILTTQKLEDVSKVCFEWLTVRKDKLVIFQLV